MRTLITEDLEEPKNDEIYLITDRPRKVMYALSFDYNHWTESYQWTESYNSFYEWQEFAVKFSGLGFYIEPLADHDARIRAEALEAEPTEAEIEAVAKKLFSAIMLYMPDKWIKQRNESNNHLIAIDEKDFLRNIDCTFQAKEFLLAALQAVKSE